MASLGFTCQHAGTVLDPESDAVNLWTTGCMRPMIAMDVAQCVSRWQCHVMGSGWMISFKFSAELRDQSEKVQCKPKCFPWGIKYLHGCSLPRYKISYNGLHCKGSSLRGMQEPWVQGVTRTVEGMLRYHGDCYPSNCVNTSFTWVTRTGEGELKNGRISLVSYLSLITRQTTEHEGWGLPNSKQST